MKEETGKLFLLGESEMEKVQSRVLMWAVGLLLDYTEIKVTFLDNTSWVILFRSSMNREILLMSGQKRKGPI